MATTHSAPIDLYAESTEGFGEEHGDDRRQSDPWQARPSENGDRDQQAIDAGQGRLEQVLGW